MTSSEDSIADLSLSLELLPKELTDLWDVGNEQTWLSRKEHVDPESIEDLESFLRWGPQLDSSKDSFKSTTDTFDGFPSLENGFNLNTPVSEPAETRKPNFPNDGSPLRRSLSENTKPPSAYYEIGDISMSTAGNNSKDTKTMDDSTATPVIGSKRKITCSTGTKIKILDEWHEVSESFEIGKPPEGSEEVNKTFDFSFTAEKQNTKTAAPVLNQSFVIGTTHREEGSFSPPNEMNVTIDLCSTPMRNCPDSEVRRRKRLLKLEKCDPNNETFDANQNLTSPILSPDLHPVAQSSPSPTIFELPETNKNNSNESTLSHSTSKPNLSAFSPKTSSTKQSPITKISLKDLSTEPSLHQQATANLSRIPLRTASRMPRFRP